MGMYCGHIMKKFTLLIFLCLWCFTAYADIATGLVGWWKIDEATAGACGGANILDATGNANTGTCHNNPTWMAGHIGTGAMAFASASSQYVLTTTATNIPATNAAQTFSAWMHCTTIAAVMDIVVTENGTQGNQFRLTATGFPQVSQWGGGTTVTATSNALTTTGWYMVTWTSTGALAGQALYVNGVLCTQTTTTAPQTGTPTGVAIGSYNAGEYFNGDIDDARIYNRVLTQADITQLYNYTGRSEGFFTLNGR